MVGSACSAKRRAATVSAVKRGPPGSSNLPPRRRLKQFGLLNVRLVTIEGYQFYWSWALFVIGTGLSFGIFLMME